MQSIIFIFFHGFIGASLLVKLNELKQYRNEYEAKEKQLAEAQHELRDMERNSEQYRTLKQRYDVKRHEFDLLQQRLQQTLHHRQVQEVDQMNAELEAMCKKADECTNILKQGYLIFYVYIFCIYIFISFKEHLFDKNIYSYCIDYL